MSFPYLTLFVPWSLLNPSHSRKERNFDYGFFLGDKILKAFKTVDGAGQYEKDSSLKRKRTEASGLPGRTSRPSEREVLVQAAHTTQCVQTLQPGVLGLGPNLYFTESGGPSLGRLFDLCGSPLRLHKMETLVPTCRGLVRRKRSSPREAPDLHSRPSANSPSMPGAGPYVWET